VKFLYVVLAAIVLEIGFAFIAVKLVEPIWARGIIMAVVPVALVLVVTFGDRED
jgi:hypothetical protein